MQIIHTQYTTNFRTFQNSSDPRPNPTHHYTRLTTLFRDYPGEPKGKTNLDFTEARDSKWQWHQLGHMQVCTSLQTDDHASTPPTQPTKNPLKISTQPNPWVDATHGNSAFTITQNALILQLLGGGLAPRHSAGTTPPAPPLGAQPPDPIHP